MTAAVPVVPGWRHVSSGKVRELYVPSGTDDVASATELLLVASDRVSAYDFALEPPIPGKGELLTRLSRFWFDRLSDVPNHILPATSGGTPVPAEVAPRSMHVMPLAMFPVECVVRGYLVGSGWAEYQESGSVCGVALPAGLANGDRLPEPIYTPAYKAPQGEHDENISFEQTVELVGRDDAEVLRDLSLRVYSEAAAIALEHGVVIADTKFEFGRDADGVVRIADEVLTSDSSRYWDARSGNRTESFDKQIVRDWLSANWDRQGTPPVLPDTIVERTAARYRELIERLGA
ncbi:phosphoribosylaminoimidazole-succinocarboxamide synthase [Curtobacterium luteum]|uniref:Phosphoribosylaminoimidazole-succinocarboxamide synthase n=1 Tax=Curtobacterium luteum TaxID=33881 RepID=A0ABS2RY02_9MICO|nr:MULTISPECIES: phosphoribosylaminoimidazolesuccinocarboxamide synthase [Curtobacterium]MBM7803916.1 phosphoribosylaminoimidazole-succinocarboxamide synthase [Curtobacterium luteum]NUU51365.1 phosphoribosylaminoimidazolesuccinocarboxamide synthase [Curtobacterium luteum]